METITHCSARPILDSRGSPTLEVTLCAGDAEVQASVPSGKSTGSHEAHELRDDDNGVRSACEKINTEIRGALVGKEPNQKEVDSLLCELDGTANKSRLGGNSLIGVSFATARLRAHLRGVPLWKDISEENRTHPSVPRFYMNVINGGVHANFSLPFQEYIIVIDSEHPREAYIQGKKIFDELGRSIQNEFGEVLLGDEGGYAPKIEDLMRPFEMLTQVIKPYSNTFLAIDAAASEFESSGKYNLLGQDYTPSDLLALYGKIRNLYDLRSIEDPFFEDDVESFVAITQRLGPDTLIVGDDLTVTNPLRLSTMIDAKAANALIIKPNQIGTLTETYETIRRAHDAGWKTIVSHRSGDTLGTFIADLSVGVGAYGLKAGSPLPQERRVKYERVIEIVENELNK